MREIKFRAWGRFDNVMLSNSDIWFRTNVQGYELFCDTPDNRDSWILMQYTGLKDKNGVEIYEGDIVKIGLNRSRFKDDIAKIKYSKSHAGFRVFSVDFECEDNEGFPLEYRIEVIGNIYENPELLEQ